MNTRYKEFDVMRSFEEWDERTQKLIEQRIASGEKIMFFSDKQKELLIDVLKVLLAEENEDIIKRVAAFIGEQLEKNKGKGYREATLPEAEILYLEGLKGIQEASAAMYSGKDFGELSHEQKIKVLEAIRQGNPGGRAWQKINGKKFFKDFLTQAVSGFYSQPEIWSQIGYAGPAYPRGYVRVELGGKDPWEAKMNE
ncbi:MAG: hypothetical protein APF76_06875 [Desulfitibacter sp. BRH_c19]|nr:MAG: hypothetical protein APF76_06875 [Desulfitibacter sp. BRH_c19]